MIQVDPEKWMVEEILLYPEAFEENWPLPSRLKKEIDHICEYGLLKISDPEIYALVKKSRQMEITIRRAKIGVGNPLRVFGLYNSELMDVTSLLDDLRKIEFKVSGCVREDVDVLIREFDHIVTYFGVFILDVTGKHNPGNLQHHLAILQDLIKKDKLSIGQKLLWNELKERYLKFDERYSHGLGELIKSI